MKARVLSTGLGTILLLDIPLENIQRYPAAGIYEVRTRPKDRLSVKLVDMFDKLLAN
jgi:hypothetical protein